MLWVVEVHICDFNCIKSRIYQVEADSYHEAEEAAMERQRRHPTPCMPGSQKYANQVFGPYRRIE